MNFILTSNPLPNITGEFVGSVRGDNDYPGTGVFNGVRCSGKTRNADWGEYLNTFYKFNANWSNNIFGSYGKVQPYTTVIQYLIKY